MGAEVAPLALFRSDRFVSVLSQLLVRLDGGIGQQTEVISQH